MAEEKRLMILCVDRDDDLGRKTGIKGPVIGRDELVKAATALAIKDPGESDANCFFAAVKKYDELKKSYKNLEVVGITGQGKAGFKADKIINEQIDKVLKKFPSEDFVLVTDGAEDDQVIPILQSRGRIMSKETLIIKQAQAVESTYYTIKEALKDPFLSRIFFGIPGIILLLYFAVGTLSFQIIAFLLGAYLIMKGFGIEDWLLKTGRSLAKSISFQRTSFPFYIGAVFVLAFGGYTAYDSFIKSSLIDLVLKTVGSAQTAYLFVVISALLVIMGKSLDLVHFKKAYMLNKQFIMGVGVLLSWFILDSGTAVILRLADLNLFIMSILVSFIVMLVAFRISESIDIRKKITKLLVGLPIYDKEGNYMGKVETIDKRRDLITYKDKKEENKIVRKRNFVLKEGRIVASSA